MPSLYSVGLSVECNDAEKELGDDECNAGANCYSADSIYGSTCITLDGYQIMILISKG